MAKWGEGDPRWIVEERADATNVNNWHWTEKNATEWSKSKLKDLLQSIAFADDIEGEFIISEISQLDGEASLNNRKSKIIYFYEWDIKLQWEGTYLEEGEFCKGTCIIPNLSDEHDPKDVDITVYLDEEYKQHQKTKEWVTKKITPVIRDSLGEYIKLLKEEFGSNMILPVEVKQKSAAASDPPVNFDKIKLADKQQPATRKSPSTSGVGVKIPTKDLNVTEKFQTLASELYSALTCKEKVQAFTRDAECQFDGQKGGKFLLFHKNISGQITELVEGKKIVMKWRAKHWPDHHYSEVTMNFEQTGGGVNLVLTQTGIPTDDFDNVQEGWKTYYFDPLKITFGFGAKLFF